MPGSFVIHLREWRGLAGQIFPMARVADWPDSYFQWRTIFTGNFGPPDQNFHGKNGPPGPILPGPKLQWQVYCTALYSPLGIWCTSKEICDLNYVVQHCLTVLPSFLSSNIGHWTCCTTKVIAHYFSFENLFTDCFNTLMASLAIQKNLWWQTIWSSKNVLLFLLTVSQRPFMAIK